MADIAQKLPITEGVDRMMTILKRVGYKTAILSGGFTYFGNYLRQKYGFDYVYANELEIENGKLTGRYLGEIVDGRRKAELLRLLCQFENIDIQQSIAVGDGANDLPMLDLAGLGIAFHAKPKVKATAKQSISTIGLDGILYFLGLEGFMDRKETVAGVLLAAAFRALCRLLRHGTAARCRVAAAASQLRHGDVAGALRRPYSADRG